ncbi:MAG: hypothetical protein CBC01_05465 [Betaproteobacteria bacterium TMED41]|nr:MAG: hypothetical protein CBC01_05465 [Betaproteobacteria bacterium TMED41]
MNQDILIEIFKTSSLIREFESSVYERVEKKILRGPVYLCAGQEYISSTLAFFFRKVKLKLQLFPQHRCHGTYISFGGDIDSLILELLGKNNGCAGGYGGSASVHSVEANIYGHDGLMGSNAPIGVGMAFGNKLSTLIFLGDAAAEEDYVLAAMGWAATKKLPVGFVVEDNNLSILTEKSIRRSWSIAKVGESFGLNAMDISDDPKVIYDALNKLKFPFVLNINTVRKFWHAGAGIDDVNAFDRHENIANLLPKDVVEEITKKNKELINQKWSDLIDS